jgi:hypothetical protein
VTVREWLANRRPAPPSALASRVAEALSERLNDDASGMFDYAIDAAISILAEVVVRPTAGRECALDLLTADALTTYAFEAAAAEPEQLVGRADDAMRRLAGIGVRHAS